MDPYHQAVDEQIAANAGNGGWQQGPVKICAEMAEEACDIAAWSVGLEDYPMTREQSERLATIVNDAALIWAAVMRLKDSYAADRPAMIRE